MHLILLTHRVPDPQLAEIQSLAADAGITAKSAWDDAEARAVMLPKATILYGHPKADELAAATELKWLHWTSAGVNLILPNLPDGVTLTKSQGVYGVPMAEHVMAMMLALGRRIPEALSGPLEGKHEMDRYNELAGATAGILGYGGIGEVLAPRLRAMGMRVIGLRRSYKAGDPVPPVLDDLMGPDRLAELLGACDHLINILPDTPATRHMFDAATFAQVKQGAMFYNIGRGVTVDHDALVEALRSGHVRAAGLDVTDPEPLPADHPLRHMQNVIVTPHNGGSGPRQNERLAIRFVENLRRYLAGEPLIGLADRESAY